MSGESFVDVPCPVGYPARAVVDLEAIRSNVRTLRAAAPTAALMAVVKADAYGHGLVPCALAGLEAGATWLGVAQASEAIELRRAGVGGRILSWLHAPGAPLAELIAAGVDVSVSAAWAVQAVSDAARATGVPARVHLKVDTGLGRNGVMPAELPAVLGAALRAEADGLLSVVGVWSHLALADEPDHPTVRAQAEVFDDAVRLAEDAGARLEVRHLANSAATLTSPRLHYDLVRPGIAVYGVSPGPRVGTAEELGLIPAMTLRARLATVKEVGAGQGVSYGHDHVTEHPTTLGVVPLGYADGVPRHASGRGPLAAPDGRRLRVTGRVCMDQIVVDLGPGAVERAGDEVELFGTGRDGGPTAQEWAEAADTIGYEIVTRIGSRVPREHVGVDRAATEPAEADLPLALTLPTADGVRDLGRRLARVLRAGDLVVLAGDLGAGKTTLTQGIGAGLGVRGQVASPTFVIARVHPPLEAAVSSAESSRSGSSDPASAPASVPEAPRPSLVHVDAYRLTSADDLESLDLEAELDDAVTVVEWGRGWVEGLSADRLEIEITRPRGLAAATGDAGDQAPEHEPDEGAAGDRLIVVRGVGARWDGVTIPLG